MNCYYGFPFPLIPHRGLVCKNPTTFRDATVPHDSLDGVRPFLPPCHSRSTDY